MVVCDNNYNYYTIFLDRICWNYYIAVVKSDDRNKVSNGAFMRNESLKPIKKSRVLRLDAEDGRAISLPPEVIWSFGWEPGDKIRFLIDDTNKRVIMEKEEPQPESESPETQNL